MICVAHVCVFGLHLCVKEEMFALLLEFKYFGHWFVLQMVACLQDMEEQ